MEAMTLKHPFPSGKCGMDRRSAGSLPAWSGGGGVAARPDAGRLPALRFQPAIEPIERFLLRRDLERVWLVVKRPAESLGEPGLRVDARQLVDGGLHRLERIE